MGTRFRVVGPLGSGGFGAVYEAIEVRTGQRVAIKELDDVSADGIARFKQEFRALSDLHHPNLVGLKELIEDERRWIIVMELVAGTDLLNFVSAGADNDNQPYDEARLRTALCGMARGLVALHGYGILHRDLKPSNVRVTPEGRAVLLDFGLVTSIDPGEQSLGIGTLGTVAYMAPEQAMRTTVGPATDWYAFGVCLFEALTGRRPFEAEMPFELLAAKRDRPAPRASTLVPDVPEDLDELCARLLERDPARRAGAREVLRVLGEDHASLTPASPARSAQPPFTGREPELLHLQRAYERTHQGALRILLVEGESGVGKSELLAEFIRRTQLEEPSLLTLHGRCYENEQVSYKAFDGCVDELARFLARLPEQSCAQLLPPRSGLLGQLFPVLRTVPALAKAAHGEWSADPTARRLEAFAALSVLLTRVAEERPLVLVIDDLQWADAESFRLLLALMEQPDPPPVLILATIRPAEELEPAVAEGIEALRRKQRIDVLPILGLPREGAAALARSLLGPAAPESYCQRIAEESGGHPLFLSELVQYVRSRDLAAHRTLSLEAALRSRVERLSAEARDLLELAALAGRPHGAHIFARALGLPEIDEPVRALLAARLLRLRKGQELDCAHDRVRHTALGLIAQLRVPELHRRLAGALASDPLADATEQARHWDLAGEPERAVAAYERAADDALDALAFARAAALYLRALELSGDVHDTRAQGILVKRANALAWGGRSAEAAELYERAAAHAEGQTHYELRGRHAQQLILCGKLSLGVSAMRSLLAELGVYIPTRPLGLLLHFVWLRLWLALRGHRFATRPARPGEERQVLTASLLASYSSAVSQLHPFAMIVLALRALRYAAKIPVPEQVIQLYARLGWLRAVERSPRRAAEMFEHSRQLATRVDQPVALANAAFIEGSAHVVNWNFSAASPCLEHAQHVLATRCPNEPWLLRNVRQHLGLTWYALGQHRRLAREMDQWIAEARERNDMLTVAMLSGVGSGFTRHLMRGAPDDAIEEVELALRDVPAEPFSFFQLGELMAVVNALLYKGGPAARQWLEERAETHSRALLLRFDVGRRTLLLYRAFAALHALESRGARERAALRAEVRTSARLLGNSRSPAMQRFARLLLAQLHVLDGRPREALAEARAACEVRAQGEEYQSFLAEYLAALLESGTPNDPRCTAVLAYFREQGWSDPLAFLRSLVPALGKLLPETKTPAPGHLVSGRFAVTQLLGGGGFGSVVEARDVHSGQLVAVKELVSKSPRSLERFKQEFRALCDVHHENLVRVDGLLEHQGSWYIAMERIHGEKLLSYVRPRGGPDRERIVGSFRGIVEGLSALHAAGFAHRDVSPENVLVGADGRAILLDFGLIARLSDARAGGAIGTLEYAAPEQLEGAPPSTAADVYSLGVCLYQALAGELPFDVAAPMLITGGRPRAEPKPLRVPGLEDLGALALRMLATEPAARPSLPEVRARLAPSARDREDEEAAVPVQAEEHACFTGREEELARLAEAFERTCDDGLTVMFVEGESGLGKSALISELGRRVEAGFPNLLLLASRCYEREQVAFKAFDGAVDQLGRALTELPAPACDELLPRRAALLGQLFPVLLGVPSIAAAPRKGLPGAPVARQRAATSAFVDLLERLTHRYEPLLLIEDLQWADAESFRLLHALLDHRERLPLLVVCTVRPADESAAETARELGVLRARDGVHSIALSGLSPAATRRLVEQLYGGPLPPERMERILDEAKGHPLFVRELVAQAKSGTASSGTLGLDAALRRRIDSFDDAARLLLSLVALAGRPYGAHVFARALGLRELSRAALITLLSHGMLRRAGGDGLATYHDRLARVARELVRPEEARRLSAALAWALEREPGSDPAERARLFREAGEVEPARAAYEQAGDRALAGLQFARAADHYARALELCAEATDEQRRRLFTRAGDALARAGRSAEAAAAYRRAAERAEGEAGVRLRILAAEQTIQSAHAEKGLTDARQILEELGVELPRSPRAALAYIAYSRVLAALRGHKLRGRPRAISARTRLRLDAAWSLSFPFAWLDPLGGAALISSHLRAALAAGEPAHGARALSTEAFVRVVQKADDRKVDRLLARARTLARDHGDGALETEVMYREGIVSTYRWDLKRARVQLERALATVNERCVDQPWLTTNVRLALGAVWFHCIEHARLAAAAEAWRTDARDRGDQFALSALHGLGYGFVRHLMADLPDRVAAELEERRDLWPREPFSFLHFGDLLATGYQLLYRGGGEADAYFARELPRLRTAALLRWGTNRGGFLNLRALAKLAAYAAEPRGPRASELLEQTHAAVAELSRVRNRFAEQAVPMFTAQLHALRGDSARALEAARAAYASARKSGHSSQAHRAKYLEAALEGGARGHDTRARLLARYAAQGWKQPGRAFAMLCPALTVIEKDSPSLESATADE